MKRTLRDAIFASGLTKYVLVTIALYPRSSHGEVATATGLDRRTVATAFAALERAGWLDVTRAGLANLRRRPESPRGGE